MAMDGTEKDLGWEDIGPNGGPQLRGAPSSAVSGTMGSMPEVGIGDAVTSAMVNHFAREFTSSSLSLWPGFVLQVRRYFNVSHGYVLRKMMWQLAPLNSTKKKSSDGEIGGDKDWMARVVDGLEVDIEEPDMYIPTMGFITYVVLCGLVRGLKDNFNSDVLSSIITFALVCLVIETVVVKAALFTAGAVNTPTVDLMSLLGYKFFYLSLHIIFGLLLGRGRKPTGFIFTMLALALAVCCGFALWQALRRLARMQPSHGQECMTDMHSITIKALPVFQALVCWVLLPTWPAADLVPVLTVLKATVTKAATVLVTTAAAAAASSSVPGAA